MTPEQETIADEYFKENWHSQVCPNCKKNKWNLEGVFACLEYTDAASPNQPLLGPASLPMLMVSCGNCFYLRQFMWLPIKRAVELKRASVAIKPSVEASEAAKRSTPKVQTPAELFLVALLEALRNPSKKNGGSSGK